MARSRSRDDNGSDSDDDDALLSYGSPQRSFTGAASVSALAAADADPVAVKEDTDGSGDGNAQTLLAFYRERCEQFQHERQLTLDQLARIEVSKEELHRLKWELRTKTEEANELEDALRKANATLHSVQRELVDAQAETARLQAQETADRRKIAQLLALTQPVTEEVTFARDCRPGTTASYPPTHQTFAYASTMHIASEIGARPRRQRVSAAGRPTHCTSSSSSSGPTRSGGRVARASGSSAHHVLRTVYLPNEQAAALSCTVESLQTQLAAHKQLADDRIQTLQDESARDKHALEQRANALDTRVLSLEQQLTHTQKLLHRSTREYLVLRHRAQETERLAREEVYALEQRSAALTAERSHAVQQAAADAQLLRKSVAAESNELAQAARSEAKARERDLHMLKEQYAAVQDACTKRIQDLQARLATLRTRYRTLEKRRAMEMEGFTRDVVALRRQLQRLDAMHYGRRLTAQERQSLRLDEHQTLDSNELSAEVAALRHRVQALAHDLSASWSSFDVHALFNRLGRVFTHISMKYITTLLLLLSAPALALANPTVDAPTIALGTPTFSGQGCVAADAVSVTLSTDGAKLTVAFPDSFHAHSGTGSSTKHSRVACNGVLPFTVLKGFSVGITRDTFEGDVSLPQDAVAADAYAMASTEVFFAAQPRGPKLKQRFTSPGATHFRIGTDDDRVTTWSACDGSSPTTTLRINTAVVAHGADASVRSSALQYTVSYKPCIESNSDVKSDIENESDSDAEDESVAQLPRVRRN